MISRRRLLATSAAAALGGLAGCARSGTTLERAVADGVLRIGISGERPFCFLDAGGKVTGAQPEVARAVLARMGIPGIEAVQMRFDQLLPALLAGQFDLIAAGMVIDPDRCAKVAFSRPDFVGPSAFLVPRGNPRDLHSFADARRAGARLAVLSGAVEVGYAHAAGIDDAALVLVPDQRHLVDAVVDRKADAGVLMAISLRDELSHNPGTGLEVTGPIVTQTRGRRIVPTAAYAMRLEDRDLLTRFDSELAGLQAEGKWLPLTSPFGFTSDNVPPSEVTTESLCRP